VEQLDGTKQRLNYPAVQIDQWLWPGVDDSLRSKTRIRDCSESGSCKLSGCIV